MHSYRLLFIAIVGLMACTPPDRSNTTSVTAAIVAAEQFQQLSWIVGRWRGAEAAGAPFFESYRMADDSTLIGHTWTDPTFSIASDSSFIRLRNGEVTSGDAVVTQWDATSVHFEPRGKAMNSYTWRKESADRWSAILYWTDKEGSAHERTYFLTRVAE